MVTTLNKIREQSPCHNGWRKLLSHLKKTSPDDEPLHLRTILDSNGLDDTLWCFPAVDGHQREMRLFGVWCARQVQSQMDDIRIVNAVDAAERFANGLVTDEELAAAWTAALEVAREVAREAGWVTAWEAAGDAARVAALEAVREVEREAGWATAWEVAGAAARAAARATAWKAAGVAAWEAAGEAARAAARDAASHTARAAEWAAARESQTNELRRVLDCIDAGVDPYPLQES